EIQVLFAVIEFGAGIGDKVGKTHAGVCLQPCLRRLVQTRQVDRGHAQQIGIETGLRVGFSRKLAHAHGAAPYVSAVDDDGNRVVAGRSEVASAEAADVYGRASQAAQHV